MSETPTNAPTSDFLSGEELLTGWGCKTREERLERACMVLLGELNRLHIARHQQDLLEHLNNPKVFCSCADAYRMGTAALKP